MSSIMGIISCFTKKIHKNTFYRMQHRRKPSVSFIKKQEIVPLRVVKKVTGKAEGIFLQELRLFSAKKHLTAFLNASTVERA